MATLYITEYATVATLPNATGQVPLEPPLAEQTVAIGGSSTPSNAFNASTKLVRLHCDTICSIEFGTAPTATTGNARMAANQTEYHGVPQGGVPLKVAVISNT